MEKREFVEHVRLGNAVYHIVMAGTMDGENTRSPVGYQVYDQAFEPNVSVKMENVGSHLVVNPWIIANGKDWRTVSSIVQRVVAQDMTDAEKALALWLFQKGLRFHASPYDRDNGNVVKMLNVYGYTLCGDDSYCLADLWREAGLRVRAGRPIGHSTTEVFYNGMWHLLDGDEHVICLMRDNKTIAGEEEIVRDHDLMKRTHVYGILKTEDRQTDEFSAALFPYEGEREEKKGVYPSHRMDLVLRPGESIEWRWEGKGKFHGRENMGSWRNAWTRICNGLLVYEPDVKSSLWRFGCVVADHVADGGALCAEVGGGSVTFEVKSPYVIVGGRIKGAFQRHDLTDRVALFVSFDREKWVEVWTMGQLGQETTEVCLDRLFLPEGDARYRYFVRVDFAGNGVSRLVMESDLQMAPLSLPGVHLGNNEMKYVDDSDDRDIKITHRWRERSDHGVPPAPERPIFPEDGSSVEGTKFVFEWADVDCDEAIVDYHFQLSAHADMCYPLSPNFDKLVSRTKTPGVTRYPIPYVGLLNPDRIYYWRVRARSVAGVWSPWSAVWSFIAQAPGVPLDVVVDLKNKKVVWQVNPKGRRPVHFLIYGSDERGFTESDTPYPVLVEKGRTAIFPAYLLGESERAEWVLPTGEKVCGFYRVVAVDGNGNRSEVSDLAETPRPVIWSVPIDRARAGEDYFYTVFAVRSIGDLRTITIGENPYNPAFRDADELTFDLMQAPKWLHINRLTGEISGRPLETGVFDVTVKVVRRQGGEAVQQYVLTVMV